MTKKVLIITGGGTRHLESFKNVASDLDIDLLCTSFSNLNFLTSSSNFDLKVGKHKVADFDVVYIRLVGKSFEEASVLSAFCRDRNIRLFDRKYKDARFIRVPYPKALETMILQTSDIPMPKTFFGSLQDINTHAPEVFGYPFVIKGTTGKQGHAVWSPRGERELAKLVEKLEKKKKDGMRFVAQEFIEGSQRIRALVIGDRVIGAITRPTRWRRRFTDDSPRRLQVQLSKSDEELAIKAAEALKIDVGGVDILKDDKTKKSYILEVNSAPRWESVKKDCGINVEREILKFLTAN